MTMFIQLFFLCPLGLAIKLNFNISKVAYWLEVGTVLICLRVAPVLLVRANSISIRLRLTFFYWKVQHRSI